MIPVNFTRKVPFQTKMIFFLIFSPPYLCAQDFSDYQIDPDDYGSNDQPVLYERIIEEREAEAERRAQEAKRSAETPSQAQGGTQKSSVEMNAPKRRSLETIEEEDEEESYLEPTTGKAEPQPPGSGYMSKYEGNISSEYKPSYTPPAKGVMPRRVPLKKDIQRNRNKSN